MKVRKLAVALALAGGLGSGVAQALGLGEIELQSYLNEPLDAEIVLPQSRGVNPGDVFVNIASEQAYEQVGLSRNQFLSKLRFQVVTRNDGSLAVNVSSREPLREPYLNFLLEMTWPSGRLMREYAVLVDPPVYAEESGVQEQVSIPAAASAETTRQSAATRSQESLRRQAQAERSLGTGYQADTFGPTGPSDTLWTIASSVRPNDSVSTQQVMLAIQDLNPDAFISNNINRLKRGEVLRVPSIDQIQSRTRTQAIRMVSQQNQEFQSPQRTMDATASQQQQQQPEARESAAGGDELKLVVSQDSGRDTSEGGSAGGDGQLPGGIDAGTAVAMEELESARRENTELNSRVVDLQDQVETLQRLLELKNTQLAEIQQATAAETPESPSSSDSDDVAGTTASDGQTAQDQPATEGEEGAGTEAEASAAADQAETDAETDTTGIADTEAAPEDASSVADAQAVTDSADEAGEDGAGEGMATGSDESEVASAASAAKEPGEQVAEPAPAASEPSQSAEQAPKPVTQAPVADKGFPGNLIDAITNNPMYQIALGGGLILLLLLLLLLARRNANREKAFYDQLNSEADEGSDSFDLDLDDEDQESVASDALEEADTYIAYGRHDQAAQTLESAISREPSRTDLRLKLLGVYADSQDRQSFERQFGEIETLEDEEALATANELRGRLEEAESMPSIDDLESQLRSDSFATSYDTESESSAEPDLEDVKPSSEELLADQFDSEQEKTEENEFGDFDSDLSDFDLNDFDEPETSGASVSPESTASSETEEPESEGQLEEGKDDLIEYDLSGLELETDEKDADSGKTPEAGEWDMSSDFEMDLEESSEGGAKTDELEDDLGLELDGSDLEDETLAGDVAQTTEEHVSSETGPDAESETESDIDSLDESFLDELDAELDKVAGEEDELGGSEMEESSLDDLELDVSDEDLALMEEFSDSADSANHDEEQVASLDEAPEQQGVAESLEDRDLSTDAGETSDEDPEFPVASDEVGEESSRSSVPDLDENDLGDDDDFDFLAGTDEAATKLDLARAYIEMGDADGARDILEEVALEGDEGQKSEAQDLLKNLS